MGDIAARYGAALRTFLDQGGEACLKQAYELGREALANGLGIMDMLTMQQEALERVGADQPSWDFISRAGEFFAESMSPFEMTHRAFGEANATLRLLNEALEEETRRIARALHDESGQLLAAIYIQLEELARDLPPDMRARLQDTKAMLDQIEQQLRHFCHELRPAILDDYGFLPALQSFAGKFSKRTGIPVSIDGEIEKRLSGTVEAAMYRIAQEALNNTAKHSKASRVNIRLWRTPRELHCSISDNGIGFDPDSLIARKQNGLGLLGIRERLNGLGGTLKIHSTPNKGAELRISVPLEE